MFGLVDYGIVFVYVFGITLFGLRFRKRQRTLHDYFLGGRTLPWWAITLSLVATESSLLTVVGMPGLVYETNMLFFQIIIGNLVGRILACIIFIPKYYAGEYVTAYQFIGSRFGPRLRLATTGIFLVSRVFAEGVRVFAASIVVSLVLKIDIPTAIVVLVLSTLIYTVAGGVRAVIWTDVTQFLLYMGGAGVAFYYIIGDVPGGFSRMIEVAGPKLQILDFSLDPLQPYTFWAGMFCGIFQTLASQGTDQMLVQRLLAARNKTQSYVAVLAAGVVFTLQYFFFLCLGAALFAFFKFHPPASSFEVSEQVFPFFVLHHLPTGLVGVIIAGMMGAAMSTTSSSLNSMASATVIDFYPGAERLEWKHQLRLSRGFTVLWAVVFVGFAMLARNWGNVVEAGLAVLSITYGSLLGIFLLGLWTQMRSETAGLIGMAAGLGTILYLRFFTPIPWTWFFAIGTLVTFAVGWTSEKIVTHMPWNDRRFSA